MIRYALSGLAGAALAATATTALITHAQREAREAERAWFSLWQLSAIDLKLIARDESEEQERREAALAEYVKRAGEYPPGFPSRGPLPEDA